MKEKNRVRNAYAVSTVSVTMVLFLLGSALYFIANATKATETITQQIKISVVVKDDITDPQTKELKGILKSIPTVLKSEYISKKQALENFSEFISEDVITSFDVNPLPASYDVYFTKDANRSETISQIESKLKKMAYVDDVLHQTDQIDQIMDNMAKIRLLVIIFGGVLLFISIVLINNTIKMNLFAKRFIIKTMLLIGATPWFVRRPFMRQAVIQGFLSSLIAFCMLMGMVYLVERTIPMAELVGGLEKFAALFGIMMGIGIFICVTLTLFAVNRYISTNGDKLHVY